MVVSHQLLIYGWLRTPTISTVTFKPQENTLALDILFFASFSKILSTITSGSTLQFALLQYPHSHLRCSNWHSLCRYWHQWKHLHMKIGSWIEQDLLPQHQLIHYSRITNACTFALHYIFLIFLSSCSNMDFYLNVSWRCLLNWWHTGNLGFGSTWSLNCYSLEYTSKMPGMLWKNIMWRQNSSDCLSLF